MINERFNVEVFLMDSSGVGGDERGVSGGSYVVGLGSGLVGGVGRENGGVV